MVSRRSRSYKEKKHFASFGQFMLPLAVLMALALLFFSVRLFFFGSSDTKRTVTPPQTVAQAPQTTSANPQTPAVTTPPAAQPEAPVQQPSTTKPTYVAGPVTSEPAAPQNAQPEKPASAQPGTAKPVQGTSASTTAKPHAAAVPSQSTSGQRFDVQIGSFASRENAQSLAQKAKGQGYDVYLSETVSNGKPFFRVRVKGAATRDAAQTLSQKLEGQGYPTLIVPPGK